MGRPRTFNEPDAVRAASDVFARRGYAGASVEELVRATGVVRASLYAAFGSKDGLFRRCLEAALADLTSGPAAGTAKPPPPQALDLVLVALMEPASDDAALAARIAEALESAGLGAADLGSRLLTRASAPTH